MEIIKKIVEERDKNKPELKFITREEILTKFEPSSLKECVECEVNFNIATGCFDISFRAKTDHQIEMFREAIGQFIKLLSLESNEENLEKNEETIILRNVLYKNLKKS